ncbi:MAG TPA: NAD(P)H-hydrate dehydratase, partial [Solirubrobacteraceae bacterium]|nr:NAD(P)H-hydrate dehydratase [Solirubrobacteraceae bacterium]
PTSTAIDALNAADAPVVAVDVPSGVDASTGVVAANAVRAAVTVTFHAAKPGLWINPGKSCAGEVQAIDIGIPRDAPSSAHIGLIASAVRERLPRRGASSTKFASGQVVVAGGSRGLAGAPQMAARASMRAGAGYVIGCTPKSLQDAIVAAATPELMTRGLAERDGGLAPAAVAGVLESIRPGGALALGPGLGRSDGAVAFARELAHDAEAPLVLDADGLNAHAGQLGELADRKHATILTPHAGELGRLLGLDSGEIERERLRHVSTAARQANAVVVLKGDDTLVAHPDGRVAVSRGGSPALATAGTGDVLTGVLAALLAQGLDAFETACAGVWLHAAAGRLAAGRQGSVEGVIATDVIEALPAARGEELR